MNTCASCCASFGELLQGELPDARRFLVTLPIQLRARAHFSVPEHLQDLRVEPHSSWKTRRLVEALLARQGLALRGELRLESDIPRGKGLSGSTADLVAAYRSVTDFYRLPQSTDELEALLRDIEPSDGVMYAGVVAYLHREARLLEHLGPVPALALVAVDEGGEVETIAHNDRPLDYFAAEREEYADLLSRLRCALSGGDIATLGAVATRSAQLNQRLQPMPAFNSMMDVAAAVGAAGIVVAHSGTYLGLVFDARRAEHSDQVRLATSQLKALGLQSTVFKTMSGQPLQEISHV